MSIQEVDIKMVKPYSNNVKIHPEKQIDAISKSIKEFGFRQPVVIDGDYVIVAGHARYEAALKLGLKKIPCEYAYDLSKKQVNAYRILDNEIAKQGMTDTEALQVEIANLPDFDFNEFNMEVKTDNLDLEISEIEPELEKKIKIHKCPSCGHQFKDK